MGPGDSPLRDNEFLPTTVAAHCTAEAGKARVTMGEFDSDGAVLGKEAGDSIQHGQVRMDEVGPSDRKGRVSRAFGASKPANRKLDLLEQRVEILTMIARDAPFEETLAAVIGLAERSEPGSIAGVTIVDRAERSLEMAVFTAVDRAFADAIAGVSLGPPHVGTCAQALYRGEVVTSENLETDTRFAKEWRQLCEDHGIRSCRSQPIRTAQGSPLGTFMLCFRQPRAIGGFDKGLMTVCAGLVELTLERRRTRERQELVIGELQHRTRNLFSSVGALSHFSYRSSSNFAEFRDIMDGRLSAMANAHAWMVAERGVDIHTLVADLLKPYAGGRPIRAAGPPLTLSTGCVMGMSMAIHELATNAAKYGALSTAEGQLDIHWDIARQADGTPWFSFRWVESGGPPVLSPTRRGFGVRAIERTLAQAIEGKVHLDFDPAGLRCLIDAPFTDRIGVKP